MELQTLFAALVGAVQPKVIEHDGRELLVAPEGFTVTDLADDHGDFPRRVQQGLVMVGLPSFIDYINRYKVESSTIFVTPDLTELAKGAILASAVLDYHEGVEVDRNSEIRKAKHGQHRVSLRAQPSLPYAKLLKIDGQLLEQDAFARELEDIARFSSSHAAADLIDIARTISLTSKGDFKSFDDEFSGSVDFKYDLQVRASAGTAERKLSVPSLISFHIPLIDGMEPVTIEAKLVYRVPDGPGGRVSLGIRIVDRLWLENEAVVAVADTVREQTLLPVYVGTL